MDLQNIISDLLGKLKLDASLLEKFKGNPMETAKSLLGGMNLDEKSLSAVVEGVLAKLNLDEAAKSGLLDKIKGLFGRG